MSSVNEKQLNRAKEKLAKFASSCRSLAAELDAGEGPELGRGCCFKNHKPCCAFGHALSMAGFNPDHAQITSNLTSLEKFTGVEFSRRGVDKDLADSATQVMNANDGVTDQHERRAIVIDPLRALAATIENKLNADLPNLQDSK